MHPEAYRGVHWAIRESGFPEHLANGLFDTRILALDLGGADINGTARRPVTEHAVRTGTFTRWDAWDIENGPGITNVVDATQPTPPAYHGLYDVVLCTEVLEHVAAWDAVLRTAHAVLIPGGFLFLTCASTGRRPHGARGDMDPAPGEHYGNVHAIDIDTALEEIKFSRWGCTYNPNPGDAYAWAVK